LEKRIGRALQLGFLGSKEKRKKEENNLPASIQDWGLVEKNKIGGRNCLPFYEKEKPKVNSGIYQYRKETLAKRGGRN